MVKKPFPERGIGGLLWKQNIAINILKNLRIHKFFIKINNTFSPIDSPPNPRRGNYG